ncbi:DNA cytosine methyltransferase [Massilia violaceinigra]|uniref:DNA cytosine methyltransferase n=1 Tax=Massilia violaceinigra TaxID=2045208 RepID=A0ABY4A1Y6_9BURK|nr:DNA cytosine methyltransferase [Massilia violaceinigra]
MTAYYNEIDPYAAQWLRNLITAGHIADGVVDTRSIEDVQPDDLREFTQCHFFAGVGVWSHALRAAGWGDDRPVWTGSCPCQPFSAAGQGAAFADERHLWPAMFHLISEHVKWLRLQKRPLPAILGEQVASKDADAWIDLVQADMETLGYSFGAVAFPSASVGAPHIRDRTYWGGVVGVGQADANDARLEGRGGMRKRAAQLAAGTRGMADGLAHAGGSCNRSQAAAADSRKSKADGPTDRAGGRGVLPGRVADADDGGRQRGRAGQAGDGRDAARIEPERLCDAGDRPGPTNGLWRDADWLGCTDGKWRPVEPGTFPLAHGAASRVGRLRAYGNAITAPAATVWIKSVMESIG